MNKAQDQIFRYLDIANGMFVAHCLLSAYISDCVCQAVRLESAWSDRVRYMVVVYTSGRQDTEENILLGMDFNNKDR